MSKQKYQHTPRNPNETQGVGRVDPLAAVATSRRTGMLPELAMGYGDAPEASELPAPDPGLAQTAWIAVAASVAGGLAANTGNKADAEALARIAYETADQVVAAYRTRVKAGVL